MLEITTHSAGETYAFGQKLAGLLQAGDVICLTGTLGAGKTLLVQGIVDALGTNDKAISPTFTIMNVYDGPTTVYHFDLYRLDYPEQLFDIGFEEYVGAEGISLIEWADKFPGNMPDHCLWLNIAAEGPANRTICLKAAGARYRQIIEELR